MPNVRSLLEDLSSKSALSTRRSASSAVSGAARRRPDRPPPGPPRRGRRWPRPRSACGRRPGTAAPAPAICGPRRSAGRCRRRTAGRPRAVRPRPSRTASTTSCAATSSPTIRATSWNTAGNGDTAGAGSVSVSGMASRSSSTAQVPFGQTRPLDDGGMQLAGISDDGVADSTSAQRPGCHGRCWAGRSVSSTPAARPMTRTASNASVACTGLPRTPRTRAVRAGRPAPHRRAAADAAATRRASRSLLRWAAGRSECVPRRGFPSSAPPPGRSRTTRYRPPRGRRCAPTPPAVRAAAWWPAAAGRPPADSVTCVVDRRGSSAGRPHWSNTPAGRNGVGRIST